MFQNLVVWTESGIVTTLASGPLKGVERPLVSRSVSCILVRSEIIAAGNKMHDYSDEEEERKVKKMCWYFRLRYQQTK